MDSGQGIMGSAFGNGRRALAEEVPVGYKRTEVGVIPSEWQAMRIGDLFESTAGGDFDPTRSSDVQSDSHPYPIYANGLSQEGLYGFCNYAENRPGSITVTARGTLGKAFYRGTPFVAIGRLLVLEPKIGMDARYFSNYINHGVHFAVESTGVPQLTAPQVARYLLPVPPESEQRAIAEALSDVDGLLAALEALIAKKRAVKQAAMQQLLTGKSRLPGFSRAWETTTLGEVADLKNGYVFKSSTYVPGGMYQIITIANVQDGHLSLNTVNTISELPSDLQDHQQLGYGDILVSMTGNVGRVCIVKRTHCLLNQRVGKLIAKGIDQLFLYYIVHDRRFPRSMIEMAVGGAQGNLGKSDITGYPCSLPKNLVEQRATTTILSDMDAEIAALERRRDKTRVVKQGMMQQLLTGRVRLISDLRNE